MGVIATASALLDAGRLPDAPPAVDRRDPRPVAFARRRDLGAVLFVLHTGDEWMAIAVLLQRDADGWNEVALVHKPWWDPAVAFEPDELMVTGGHSRFQVAGSSEAALIAGQAAADATLEGDGGAVALHPPGGHFVDVVEVARAGRAVTLTARRGDIEQTLIFEPLDAG